MCEAKKLAQQITNLIEQTNQLYNEYNKKMSNITLKIEDVLHYIENDNFNACQGYVYAKKLQELRQERRLIKNELEPLHMLKTRLENNINIRELSKTVDIIHKKEVALQDCAGGKKYKPRVITKDDVLVLQ